ncbi:CpXC domain-containing protein, partial [Patescibacteria group bacterium]|nr:CpXC domain-containing protein [Patescibacteria group bacterium]
MTLANTTIIKCGNCGNKIEVRLYKTVNVDIDPYLKERVLSGNINSGFCDKCNTLNKLADYFVYHDMKLGLMFYVCNKKFKDRTVEIEKNISDAMKDIEEKIPKSWTKKSKNIVVFGIDDLKEKLKRAGDLLRSELKLYSRGKYGIELIANLYIDNKKLIIESKDQKVKDDLYKSINALTENGGIFLFEYIFRNDDLFLEGALVNINHPSFLYALKNCSYLWQSNKVYGGYTIYGFDSCLFELESNNKNAQYFLLGSSEKNLANQKFIMKIFAHNHKNKEYSSHILQRAVQSGPIHNFYRAITLEDRNK